MAKKISPETQDAIDAHARALTSKAVADREARVAELLAMRVPVAEVDEFVKRTEALVPKGRR